MSSILIDTQKYAIYARILQGAAGGRVISIVNGHIHVGPTPEPLSERAAAAIKQIESGIDALQHEVGAHTKSAIGA